ncbi:MAG: putative oxidoreductase, short chain dehydrogenase/reductase family [Modestobacter sp.]|nr:putative oxidoreductase, short chain dehydrogenase/reductase family [Modestobacter sp.]
MDLGLHGRHIVLAGAADAARAAVAQLLTEEGAAVVTAALAEAAQCEAVEQEVVDAVVVVLPPAPPDAVDVLTDPATLFTAWQPVVDTAALYRAVVPGMAARGGGRLLAVLPTAVKAVGAAGGDLDTAVGLGLLGMHKVVAAEHGAQGVTANAVLRGGLATDSDVADAVAWFVSAHSGYVTGCAVTVDGGVQPSVF